MRWLVGVPFGLSWFSSRYFLFVHKYNAAKTNVDVVPTLTRKVNDRFTHNYNIIINSGNEGFSQSSDISEVDYIPDTSNELDTATSACTSFLLILLSFVITIVNVIVVLFLKRSSNNSNIQEDQKKDSKTACLDDKIELKSNNDIVREIV